MCIRDSAETTHEPTLGAIPPLTPRRLDASRRVAARSPGETLRAAYALCRTRPGDPDARRLRSGSIVGIRVRHGSFGIWEERTSVQLDPIARVARSARLLPLHQPHRRRRGPGHDAAQPLPAVGPRARPAGRPSKLDAAAALSVPG